MAKKAPVDAGDAVNVRHGARQAPPTTNSYADIATPNYSATYPAPPHSTTPAQPSQYFTRQTREWTRISMKVEFGARCKLSCMREAFRERTCYIIRWH